MRYTFSYKWSFVSNTKRIQPELYIFHSGKEYYISLLSNFVIKSWPDKFKNVRQGRTSLHTFSCQWLFDILILATICGKKNERNLSWTTYVIEQVLLTHWGRDKMVDFSQTTFLNAFSWMKMFEFGNNNRINNIPALVQRMPWRRPSDWREEIFNHVLNSILSSPNIIWVG